MIVNYIESGWEVITQRAHGIVAAELASHWKKNDRPVRWFETLLAIAEHDDAEVELDGEELITATGGPLNFAMKKFDLEHCLKLSKLTATKSRYIALLVSMHMEFLHKKEAAVNKEAAIFLKQQSELQKQWRQQLGIDEKEAKRVYYLLEFCDAFSLILCQKQLPPENRGIEISTGPDGNVYNVFQVGDATLTVKPWPFEEESFSIRYESRTINQLKFESSIEFRQAFTEAAIKDNKWEVTRLKEKVKKPAKV
jgi:hypothetical protein